MKRYSSKIKAFLLPILVVFCTIGEVEGRLITTINDQWQFHRGDIPDPFNNREDVSWEGVTLPHTWNAFDPFDEKPGYYLGIGWYRRPLLLHEFSAGKKSFLYFEAVNQTAEVYVNGSLAGTHIGGYTAFCIEITDFLKPTGNVIHVKADNSHDLMIPPLKGDFNFYGGIYRDVHLITTGDIHFDLQDRGSSGIYVTSPSVSDSAATILVTGRIIRPESMQHTKARLKWEIRKADSEVVAMKALGIEKIEMDGSFSFALDIKQPHLWSPDDPFLYRLTCEIRDTSESQVIDAVTQNIGIRWFSFDPDSGFILNGKPLKLIGVNRHQDYLGKGNALSNTRHLHDMELIKNMGCNFFRTAHYPQDRAVLEACDRLGLLVSMEIPLDHEITDDSVFFRNTKRMMREMIRQYYNHPSIVIWAYMNEMFLGRELERDREHIDKIVALAKELEKLTRREDPSRYTMIPNHGDFEVYHESGLTDIPMIIGWNLYFGWYESDLEGFGRFMDHAHAIIPGKPMIVTEYGAGAHPEIRSFEPARFDFSQEWETEFHRAHIRQITDRPFIAGSAVWNMFDFGSVNRADAMPYMNNKGLMTFDRRPKDAYHLYRAFLSQEPYVAFGGEGWKHWVLPSDGQGNSAIVPVQVFSNDESGELMVDGISAGKQQFIDGLASWNIDMIRGNHHLVVNTESQKIEKDLNIEIIPAFDTYGGALLSVNLGANYYYREVDTEVVWIPGQISENGSWGYVGGEAFMPRNRGIGTDRNITQTTEDPLFQTQVMGVDALHFKLANGDYRVRLCFAELENKQGGERVFGVSVNGKMVIPELDLARDYGRYVAVERSIGVTVERETLDIVFHGRAGKAIVGAIQVMRE